MLLIMLDPTSCPPKGPAVVGRTGHRGGYACRKACMADLPSNLPPPRTQPPFPQPGRCSRGPAGGRATPPPGCCLSAAPLRPPGGGPSPPTPLPHPRLRRPPATAPRSTCAPPSRPGAALAPPLLMPVASLGGRHPGWDPRDPQPILGQTNCPQPIPGSEPMPRSQS